jgi:hypothetical protein
VTSASSISAQDGQLSLNGEAQSVCVGVDAQLLLVATTIDMHREDMDGCV